ncbi:glycosyltransferase [Georgenia muralis]
MASPAPITTPRIIVALAAYNGADFIESQINSILAQTGVRVSIVVGVDKSADGTEAIVDRLAARDSRVVRLNTGEPAGGAAANFYRILRQINTDDHAFVALADQDDIWLPDKLQRAIEKLRESGSSGYSSSVWEWHDGETPRIRLLRKDHPQRPWDHLFSSPGPGCTFVLCTKEFTEFASWLNARSRAVDADYHDWLIYAWWRTREHVWHIDHRAGMLYRQHGGNQIGANSGWRAARHRIRLIHESWYFEQVAAIAEVLGVSDLHPVSLLRSRRFGSRLRLALMANQLRRAPLEAITLALLLIYDQALHRNQRRL